MDQVNWNKRALKEVRGFPEQIKKELGLLIYRLQLGESLPMPQSRPMSSLGIGCHELRVTGEDGIYRAFYYLKIKDKILIFHAFKKSTQKTASRDVSQGRRNLREMLNEEN